MPPMKPDRLERARSSAWVVFGTAGLAAWLGGCSCDCATLPEEPLGPECPEGQVFRGTSCGPADLPFCAPPGEPSRINERGGCPPGYVCVEAAYGCVPDPACTGPITDNDMDGFFTCSGAASDCDDDDASIHPPPGAPEVCDGRDNDCDLVVDNGCADADGDGFHVCTAAAFDRSICPAASDPTYFDALNFFEHCDCDDGNAAVNPSAVDTCDLAFASLGGADCNPCANACEIGSTCCPAVNGCVSTVADPANCGGCGIPCGLAFCSGGLCLSGPDPVDPTPEEELSSDPNPQNYPAISWNWSHPSWYFGRGFWWSAWEYDYGVVWVVEIGNRGAVAFGGKYLNFCPGGWPTPRWLPGGFDPCTRFSWTGGDVYPSRFLRALDTNQTLVDITPGGNSGYGVAWMEGAGGGTAIYFGNVEQYGLWGGWFLPVTGGGSQAFAPRLASSPWSYLWGAATGLAFHDDRLDGRNQAFFHPLYGRFHAWYWWGGDHQVSNDPSGGVFSSIAWSPRGWGVVWVSLDQADLHFAVVRENGTVRTGPVSLGTRTNVVQVSPSLVWDEEQGVFAVAWEANSSPIGTANEDVYFAQISDDGRILGGSPLRVTSLPSNQRAPSLAYGRQDYGLAWFDNRAGVGHENVYFARIGRDGRTLLEQTPMTSHAGSGRAERPDITYAYQADFLGGICSRTGLGGRLCPTGEYGLVYSDQAFDGAPARVKFRRLVRRR